ncbi:MAG: hypothetical protein CVU00_11505 [Bacteroidetes bacterium HGW-Bacteroidetes-17]|nr:MAG: hypothetical protein CVU00_11505 [Bacteroidetes bacterium HGW-Bacteroidetes-17]
MKQKDKMPIMIGTNETFFYEGNIIFVKAFGEQTAEIARLHQENHFKLASTIEGKISYLIDVNKSGKNAPEARLIWKQLSENEHTSKVAIFGLSPVSRVIASFVIGRSSLTNQRFFKTKEEAMIWLSE